MLISACGSPGLAPQPLASCRFPSEQGFPAVESNRPTLRFVYDLDDRAGARLAAELADAFRQMTGVPFLYAAVTGTTAHPTQLLCNRLECSLNAVAVGTLAQRLDPQPARGGVVRTRRIQWGERQLWLLQGASPLMQSAAAYRFLYALGVRFYHPRATYYPSRTALAIPPSAERTEAPAYAVRGWHIETRQPTPAARAFLYPAGDAEARVTEIVDWLVANGQTLLEWSLPATWDAQQESHFLRIAAYARSRGLETGALLAFGPHFDGAWSPAARVSRAARLGLDRIVLSQETPIGPSLDAAQARDALAEAAAFAVTGVALPVYWHASDPALRESAHPVTNPAIGYLADGDPVRDLFSTDSSASLANRQLLLLSEESDKRQTGLWSYVSTGDARDIDVPVFLPALWYARWIDLQQLRSIPQVRTHIASDTGWEWGYWANAAIVFGAVWEPQRSFEQLVADTFGPLGRNTCDRVTGTLAALSAEQYRLAVGENLAPYFTGQNALLEGLADAGVPVRPLRPTFAALLRDERLAAHVETDVLPALTQHVAEWTARERSLFPAIPRVDEPARPFLQELVDAIVITRLYQQHTVSLLRAAAALRAGDFPAARLHAQDARDQTSIAGLMVSAREPLYRFQGGQSASKSYLDSVRTLELWTRDETALERLLFQAEQAERSSTFKDQGSRPASNSSSRPSPLPGTTSAIDP